MTDLGFFVSFAAAMAAEGAMVIPVAGDYGLGGSSCGSREIVRRSRTHSGARMLSGFAGLYMSSREA